MYLMLPSIQPHVWPPLAHGETNQGAPSAQEQVHAAQK